jgi:hypothetical protein
LTRGPRRTSDTTIWRAGCFGDSEPCCRKPIVGNTVPNRSRMRVNHDCISRSNSWPGDDRGERSQ